MRLVLVPLPPAGRVGDGPDEGLARREEPGVDPHPPSHPVEPQQCPVTVGHIADAPPGREERFSDDDDEIISVSFAADYLIAGTRRRMTQRRADANRPR
jgi:hypothetical protein